MPAAAVIPTPQVNAKVAAVKKFVFGFLVFDLGPFILMCDLARYLPVPGDSLPGAWLP